MKIPDLSRYQCPRCSRAGHLHIAEESDSHHKIVKCQFCWWWTWLKNLHALPLIKKK